MIPSTSLFGRSQRRRVQLHTTTASKGSGTAPVVASYKLLASGYAVDQAGAIFEQWCLTGPTSDFEVQATLLSGTLSAGTTGSWLALSADRTWSVQAGLVNHSRTAVLLIEIREVATGTVRASANITIIAEYEP